MIVKQNKAKTGTQKCQICQHCKFCVVTEKLDYVHFEWIRNK